MRSVLSKVTRIAVASLLSSAAAVGCSTDKLDPAGTLEERETKGKLDLSLLLAPGIAINTVSYSITGGPTPRSGTINVTDPESTASALIGGLLAGDGYVVTLSATTTSTPPVACTGTSRPFSIVADGTASVRVALQCAAPPETRGEAEINATFNQCPTLTSWIASPLQVSVGGVIDVSAEVSDPNGTGALTYAWTATGGSFANPSALVTTYTCSAVGTQELTITVLDEGADPGSDSDDCSDIENITVQCGATIICGDGDTTPPEQCDDGNTTNGDGCSSTCQTETAPGGSGGGGGGGASGAGSGGGGAGGTSAGSGGTAAGAAGVSGSGTGPSSVCGNGVQEGTEQCDPNTGPGADNAHAANGTDACSYTCVSVAGATPACIACESQPDFQCLPLASCHNAENLPTVASQLLCDDVLSCIRSTACAYNPVNGGYDAQRCYCGSVDPTQCGSAPATGAGSPNGLCKAIIEVASGIPNPLPSDIMSVLQSTSNPAGAAITRVFCEGFGCTAECLAPPSP